MITRRRLIIILAVIAVVVIIASAFVKPSKQNNYTAEEAKLFCKAYASVFGERAAKRECPNYVDIKSLSKRKRLKLSEAYFNELCQHEAGEFIYKTVDNVEGIYQMRPREHATDVMLADPYAMEDPYGHTEGEARDPAYAFVGPKKYRFFETNLSKDKLPEWKKKYRDSTMFLRPDPTSKYERYYGYDGENLRSLHKEYDSMLKSSYGYTWRGVKRPFDRSLAVVGGELAVVDLKNQQMLALRRGFIRSGNVKNKSTGIWWLGGQVCPKNTGFNEDNYIFISKVLKPKLHLAEEE